ncbi:MAG: branched-chain amino acid ABC transporter permease [Acidimicrobiia bacterium]|nr:branched-chain amino acid ABC transporter permease [Acidimicrobiia bacterium]
MARTSPYLVTDYRQELKAFGTGWKRFGVLVAAVLWLITPLQVGDAWLFILNFIAVFAIGGIGLNLLTGFAGQVSLGHAFFLGVGAYAAAWFGGQQELPLVLWLPIAGLVGAAIGALVGPIALRLSGHYLAIVTLALLFIGEHIFLEWTSVTGGTRGVRVNAGLSIGPVDFTALDVAGTTYSREQGLFWLLWGLVALAAVLAFNIVRTRPGRALQAIRDRDTAAEVIGVNITRYKVGVFAISSAYAAIAGGLYGAALLRSVRPEQFGDFNGILLSITFIAIIIVGGMGTTVGAILGSFVVVGLPRVIERFSGDLPFLIQGAGDSGLIRVSQFNNMLFGLLIIVFLLVEPMGIAAIWRRITTYFKAWPFSY